VLFFIPNQSMVMTFLDEKEIGLDDGSHPKTVVLLPLLNSMWRSRAIAWTVSHLAHKMLNIDTGASGNVLLRLPDILPQGLMNSLMEFEQTAHESLKLGFAEAERRLVVLGKKE
jgi:hypothetical protein